MTAQGDSREPLGKPEQDMASGSVWLPSARRRSSDPCSHSRETLSLWLAPRKQMVTLTMSRHAPIGSRSEGGAGGSSDVEQQQERELLTI